MKKLSSNSLFHFLKRKEWLLEIINSMSIRTWYVLEDFPSWKGKYLIPMKCFCDIPLGDIHKHIGNYGKYGIGLTKEFGVKNYINPVCYYYENSGSIFSFMTVVDPNNPNNELMLSYFKSMYSKDGHQNFYDEREWRLVKGKIIEVTNKREEEIEELKNKANLDKENTKSIDLHIGDIQYLFVKDEIELHDFFEAINNLNLSSYDKDLLKSKLITSDQIFADF